MSNEVEPTTQPAPAKLLGGRNPAFWPSPRQLLLVLVSYFALQVILRVVFSSSVDLDESEQVVLGQQFCWGYGSDPPLYTWLQMPFFRILGESVLALSLLKNLLLLGTFWFTYASARLITRTQALSVAAALSLFFFPEIAWESQRDLTHTVLSATLAVATLYCWLRLHQQRRTAWYIWFGSCAGLGILSKYNYAFWLVGLLLAAVSLPDFRPAALDKRMLLVLGIGLLVFLPNGLWMLGHRDLALLTASKFEIRQSLSWWQVAGTGVKNLLQSIVAFSAPLGLIYLLLFVKAPVQQGPPIATSPAYRTLLVRTWLAILGILLLLVLVAHATGFKERWFQPILICLPVLGVLLVGNRLSPLRLKFLAGLSLVVMLAVAIVMPGRLLVAERFKREEPLTRPYAQLAAQLRPAIPTSALVVCDTRLLAGNLRLGLPQARVLCPELTPLLGGSPRHCFLVWDARQSDSPPDLLRQWAAANAPKKLDGLQPRYFSEVYRYHRIKQYRLGLLQLY